MPGEDVNEASSWKKMNFIFANAIWFPVFALYPNSQDNNFGKLNFWINEENFAILQKPVERCILNQRGIVGAVSAIGWIGKHVGAC